MLDDGLGLDYELIAHFAGIWWPHSQVGANSTSTKAPGFPAVVPGNNKNAPVQVTQHGVKRWGMHPDSAVDVVADFVVTVVVCTFSLVLLVACRGSVQQTK